MLQVHKITRTGRFSHFMCFGAQNPGLPYKLWRFFFFFRLFIPTSFSLKDWAPIMETLATFASARVEWEMDAREVEEATA